MSIRTTETFHARPPTPPHRFTNQASDGEDGSDGAPGIGQNAPGGVNLTMVLAKRLVGCVAVVASLGASWVEADWKVSPPVTYYGMCDASGGAALGTNLFAVADDEENQLRIYWADAGGQPQQVVDLSRFLQLDPDYPEADLEGAAWLGDKIFWIGSHGRNHEGKHRPNRHRFFATTAWPAPAGVRLQPVGVAYKKLLKDFDKDPRLRRFNLAAAAKRAPKSKDALNIEGLCAAGPTSLWIGFRNPIPNGRALLVPMLNPNLVIVGKSAKFGPPLLLDLGGLGVRDLANWQGKILILAGPYDTEKDFRIYVWDGGEDPPQPVPGLDFGNLTPEALVVFPRSDRFLVLSDDGTLKIQGIDCKRLPDPSQRRFQAVWVSP